MTAPLAIDLFCGLGGWTEGCLAEGFDVIGFDNQRDFGQVYPGQLIVQDVRTLDGGQFKDAALIVASPPCQKYSYMAMPWKRGKQIARALQGEGEFPDNYRGSRTIGDLNALFDACFRIREEASRAAGWRIPLVVENVRGAQKWVGRSAWNYGSYYLWGDVPALMPIPNRKAAYKSEGLNWSDRSKRGQDFTRRAGDYAIKCGGDWFGRGNSSPMRCSRSGSKKRRAAQVLIAKIPFPLAQHIASVYKNSRERR